MGNGGWPVTFSFTILKFTGHTQQESDNCRDRPTLNSGVFDCGLIAGLDESS